MKTFQCTCKVCGKVFESTSARSVVCYDIHKVKCAYCGKLVSMTHDELARGKKTCSNECRYKLSQQVYQDRYNKESNPENHEKLQQKMKATMRARYGVDNIMQSKEAQERSLATRRERYGDHLEALVAKQKATNLARRGVEFLQQDPEIKYRSQQTCLEKYGVTNYAKSLEFHAQVITDPTKAADATAFNSDARSYILKNFPDALPTLHDLSVKCGMRESSVGWIIDAQHCQDLVSLAYSYMEDEVYTYLVNILPEGTEIQRNTFKVITPYELDLYLPDYKIGIECNPTWTHNSSCAIYESSSQGDKPKAKDYHKKKTDICESSDIFLFHIFGYEWTHSKDIIKSMLANILNVNAFKLGARQTVVREVSHLEAMQFLDANHRQGACNSKVRLGLYFHDELVSLMTFSAMRNTIGASAQCNENCWELARFCNKQNTTVSGAASKLFNYFVRTYHPEEIRSFSDRAHTRGNIYKKLGFMFDHVSDPGYMWVNIKTDVGYARNNAQKQNIKKFLHDNAIDLNKTEVQIMEEHDYVQVFDSGVVLWVWRSDQHESMEA